MADLIANKLVSEDMGMAAKTAEKVIPVVSKASETWLKVVDKVQVANRETLEGVECTSAQMTFEVLYDEIMAVLNSAFFPYLLVTFGLNIPCFAFGLASMVSPDCSSSWLIYNTFLVIMHMGISVYAVRRIKRKSKKEKGLTETETTGGGITETPYIRVDAAKPPGGKANSWTRIKIVMFYDLVMAVYYILYVVWLIWLGIGVARVMNHEVSSSCGRWVLMSVIFGFLYVGLGAVSLVVSLCLLRYRLIQEAEKLGESAEEDLLAGNCGIGLA